MPRERRPPKRYRPSSESEGEAEDSSSKSSTPLSQPSSQPSGSPKRTKPGEKKKKAIAAPAPAQPQEASPVSNPPPASEATPPPELYSVPPPTLMAQDIKVQNPFDEFEQQHPPPPAPNPHTLKTLNPPVSRDPNKMGGATNGFVSGPAYPCGICRQEVSDNDEAILCEAHCNQWFHRVCTGLTEAAYHLLTAEQAAEWACDNCLRTQNIPPVRLKDQPLSMM
ncbi:pygopus homolog 2-like [Branchiostoma lanceolatum]|uniref:PYGO1 protein n=1 Tax=Branchiostoma lanceolatum TaxID=7740 RepID=A0A8K0EKE6_BRALA|nr:PYGO1 [Branchiostoma lanceolatum]